MRREGDRKKALSHRLLAWLVATAVSDTVWNSVRPLYRNLELRPSRENFRPGALGLCSLKKEWCSTADFHKFLQERYEDKLKPAIQKTFIN